MDPNVRERRRQEAATEGRRRAGVAIVLAAVAHLIGLPLLALVFAPGPTATAPMQEKVSYRQIPAAEWDAAMGTARRDGPAPEAAERKQRTEPVPEPAEERKERVPKTPGQVVETAPGNGEEDPDAKLAAETSNRVERETIARDRAPGSKVTMPKQTTTQPAAEPPEAPATERPGDGLALGQGGDGQEGASGEAGSKLEIPTVEERDELALEPGADGEGAFRNREGSEKVHGNSDRFRVQVGDGAGDADAGGTGAPAGTGGRPLQLFPTQATLDSITGGPAPDHVEGMAEGDGTFLNTREWKYASFFNRVKRNVSETWKPVDELRKRDPTGQIYAFKDRHTLLGVSLDAQGRISDVYVERSSGVDFLDREAIAAFERAQPFPNPPSGLFDERGRVHFQFGFYLELGRPSFRLFR